MHLSLESSLPPINQAGPDLSTKPLSELSAVNRHQSLARESSSGKPFSELSASKSMDVRTQGIYALPNARVGATAHTHPENRAPLSF